MIHEQVYMKFAVEVSVKNYSLTELQPLTLFAKLFKLLK